MIKHLIIGNNWIHFNFHLCTGVFFKLGNVDPGPPSTMTNASVFLDMFLFLIKSNGKQTCSLKNYKSLKTFYNFYKECFSCLK